MDDLVKRLTVLASWPILHKIDREVVAKAVRLLEAQAAEIAALRAQADRDWVTPLLRWTEYGALYLGGMRIAKLNSIAARYEATVGETWRTIICKDYDTEAEARAAVEAAVREALQPKGET